MGTVRLTGLLMLLALMSCSQKMPTYTSSDIDILMEQKHVELYRKAPKVWPAKGRVVATADELIFIPSPYFGALYLNGQDSTVINLRDTVILEKKPWMWVFPFGIEITTGEGVNYSFVSVRRNELIEKIRALNQQD
ncbi:hypothetical protein [Pontibacter anaerobius]|uniref:GRAM domain-containing protein n=1 Tax=Pontibacter anaerobius TaxID=2993940 RepID=A0ABT3RG28_9BACT|nr:hypothetical protein [Pontibacter anaerobius]MCX2740433.1 hypothetical protein [Pontibacter anaerobius]